MSSGSGTSGSTAWSNSVRSRLYLERPKEKEGGDLRILTTKKANYAKAEGALRLEWHRGAFRLAPDVPSQKKTARPTEAAKQRFIELLNAYNADGRRVSETFSANYAPKVFAADRRAEGLAKADLAAAMDALFAEKRLTVEVTGPKSRRVRRLVAVGETPK